MAKGEQKSNKETRKPKAEKNKKPAGTMTPKPGGAVAAADNEVDAVRWLTPREARETLTYGRDAEIVKRVLGA